MLTMPCAESSGTEYIDAVVKKFFSGSYAKALEACVHDPINKWCPTWIRRNYDVQNSDEAHDQDAIAVTKKFVFQDSEPENESATIDKIETLQDDVVIPVRDQGERVLRYTSMQRLPLDQGEPKQNNTNDEPEIQHDPDAWNPADREKWQLHSALGPNLNAEGFVYKKEPLHEHVNPVDYDYSKSSEGIDVEDLQKRWEKFKKITQNIVMKA